MHYLLIHYDVPLVDEESWRLDIGGAVERPLSLSMTDLHRRADVDLIATMECAGNGRALLEPRPISQPWLVEAVGTARWRGVPLGALLREADPSPDAVEVLFTGLDHGLEGDVEQRYERSLPLAEAFESGALLAYEMNGHALPPQHGFPLRLVVPGWYGMTNVKWLTEITILEEPFAGYQMTTSYRFRQTEDEDGRPVTRMRPRALMVPPGIPDFLTRQRIVDGPVRLEGRAWSGRSGITRVEVSDDGGSSWHEAQIERDIDDRWAWVRWTFEWRPSQAGETVLCCRATDGSGETQPLDPEWNIGGYENNAVQRVPVTVR
jgi:DMSO/TMAO reductase YedYZ molybdopterin-dependent catalytic subunit